jgi:hypothetical protein
VSLGLKTTNPPAGHLERADREEESRHVLVHRRFVTEERTPMIMGRDPEICLRTVESAVHGMAHCARHASASSQD